MSAVAPPRVQLSTSLDRRAWIAAATIFASCIGMGGVLPVFAFLVFDLGGGAVEATLLVASFSLASALASPIAGRLSDRFGRRRVVLGLLTGSVVAFGGMALGGTLVSLFIFRALCGAMSSSESIAIAHATDRREGHEHVRIMGTLTAMRGVGICLGPAISGLAGLLISDRGLYYHTVFIASMCAAAIAWLVAFLWLHDLERIPAKAQGLSDGTRGASDRLLTPYMLIVFGVMFAFGTLMAITNVFALKVFQWGPSEAGLLLGACSVVIIGVRFQLATIRKYLSAHQLIASMSVVGAASMAAMGLSTNQFAFAAFDAVFCAAYACAHLTASSEISRLSEPTRRGRTLGISQSLSSGALLASAIAAGLLFQFEGYRVPYTTAALALFCFGMTFLFLYTRTSKGVPSCKPLK